MDMSAPNTSFHFFSELPLELREEIWRYCLPYRVCELDSPFDEIVFNCKSQDPTICDLYLTTRRNGCPPLISRVCHESRSVSLKKGSFATFDNIHQPENMTWSSGTDIYEAWQDRARDSAHLNWNSIYKADFHYSGSHFHFLSLVAAQLSGIASLTIQAIDPCFGNYTWIHNLSPIQPPIIPKLSPDRLRDLEGLRMRSAWLVVMQTIIVHCDHKTATASGLFGHMGDAWVQIIEVSDEATITKYFDLAELCERDAQVTIRQDFARESADSLRQRLRVSVLRMFGFEELASKMRPAIMFRLCTLMCNHVTLEDGGDKINQD